MSNNTEFKYEVAPPGSPDTFRLTQDVVYTWKNPPLWIWKIVMRGEIMLPDGYLFAFISMGNLFIAARVYSGFYFAVSVAPNFPKAIGPASLHDWIYKNAEAIAAEWGCSVRTVLHIADHWFLALMRFTGFGLGRTYFCGVRMVGYLFHRLFSKDKK